MKSQLLDRIVNSVLYEGYLLYPYRESAMKNRHRWNFGLVYPPGIEPSSMTTECLVHGDPGAFLDVEVRFLHLSMRGMRQEAVERKIEIHFGTGEKERTEMFGFGDLAGTVEIAARQAAERLHRISVRISNRTCCQPLDEAHRDEILLRSLVSTHTILSVRGGEFISLLDPPKEFRAAASQCVNVGTWPVLVGRVPERDCMLSSPIILYDYPQVAAESPGDLFDSTEIDEILTLRILTLTDDEKEQIRRGDVRGRRILERVESLTPDQLLSLHGRMREPRANLKAGDRVRLRPKPGGEVLDVVLAGRVAIVESVAQDFEDRIHVAVVIEDDPGKDLGMMGQPGHRFFFSADEVELLS
ncbi:MAG TPA: hypothetical protein VE422_17235 [Terriglobia bacterium]|nr:hypothetical protein [Terriglobia bacterium]